MFQRATQRGIKLRIALTGISGSGKTILSLTIASVIGKKIALIDTEHGSSCRYADRFTFDVCQLTDHSIQNYIKAIKSAEKGNYDVIIIDSLTHAWFDELNKVRQEKNSFTAWNKVRPLERQLIQTIVSSKSHIIATMRTRTQWEIQDNEKGQKVPIRIGTVPIQSSGIEYEFDVFGQLDIDHNLTIWKSRYDAISNQTYSKPGYDFGKKLLAWIEPWTAWKTKDDAIAWGASQLPDVALEEIQKMFADLPAENGKKAQAWVSYVHQLNKF